MGSSCHLPGDGGPTAASQLPSRGLRGCSPSLLQDTRGTVGLAILGEGHLWSLTMFKGPDLPTPPSPVQEVPDGCNRRTPFPNSMGLGGRSWVGLGCSHTEGCSPGPLGGWQWSAGQQGAGEERPSPREMGVPAAAASAEGPSQAWQGPPPHHLGTTNESHRASATLGAFASQPLAESLAATPGHTERLCMLQPEPKAVTSRGPPTDRLPIQGLMLIPQKGNDRPRTASYLGALRPSTTSCLARSRELQGPCLPRVARAACPPSLLTLA